MTTEENDAIWLETTIIKTKSGKTLEIINQLNPNYYINITEMELYRKKYDAKDSLIFVLIVSILIVLFVWNISWTIGGIYVAIWIILTIFAGYKYWMARKEYMKYKEQIPHMQGNMKSSINAYGMDIVDMQLALFLTDVSDTYTIIDYDVTDYEKIMFEYVTDNGDYFRRVFAKKVAGNILIDHDQVIISSQGVIFNMKIKI